MAEAAERLGVPPSQINALVDKGELQLEYAPHVSELFEITEASLERYEHRRRQSGLECSHPVMAIGAAARMLGISESEVVARITTGQLEGVEIDGTLHAVLWAPGAEPRDPW